MKVLRYLLGVRIHTPVSAALLAVSFFFPAEAQRSCSVTFAIPHAKSASSTARSAGVEVSLAKAPSAVVGGGGQALLTDPDGATFSHQFAFSAVVQNDGSAQGQASFVFPLQFSQKWGALPGVDLMLLKGEITAGSVAVDGTVTLTGPFLETDFTRAEGIVYQEDSSVSGAPPLRIVVAPASKTFTLTWCSFIPPAGTGSFSVEVTNGSLKVN